LIFRRQNPPPGGDDVLSDAAEDNGDLEGSTASRKLMQTMARRWPSFANWAPPRR